MLLIQFKEYNNDIFTIVKIIYIIYFMKFRVFGSELQFKIDTFRLKGFEYMKIKAVSYTHLDVYKRQYIYLKNLNIFIKKYKLRMYGERKQ